SLPAPADRCSLRLGYRLVHSAADGSRRTRRAGSGAPPSTLSDNNLSHGRLVFMPRSTEMRFACPCGTTFAATHHQVVNVTLEPPLLYPLLEGTLNVAVCPNCGRKAESAQPFFYHDMKRGLFAYVHPDTDLPQQDREILLQHLRRVYSTAVAESE